MERVKLNSAFESSGQGLNHSGAQGGLGAVDRNHHSGGHYHEQ
jgi:hypothetical protein